MDFTTSEKKYSMLHDIVNTGCRNPQEDNSNSLGQDSENSKFHKIQILNKDEVKVRTLFNLQSFKRKNKKEKMTNKVEEADRFCKKCYFCC